MLGIRERERDSKKHLNRVSVIERVSVDLGTSEGKCVHEVVY